MFIAQDDLFGFLRSLNFEQRQLCSEAANLALSSRRLYQRLIIYKRFFIAMNRAPHIPENESHTKRKKAVGVVEEKAAVKSPCSNKASTNPMTGLVKVGSKAALNFAFAFLRRAWRLGKRSCIVISC